jgi:endonuclease/exonuclease/phosphatase family metal-dependent hydrolase
MTSARLCMFSAVLWVGTGSALAQWNPPSGQWGKASPDEVRIMTWNIFDHICRTADKTEGLNGWTALARIVAALRPDVWIMQEAGDNSGNGTGSGVDSVAQLTTTLELFFHGGDDPFLGGTVTAYVQKYAPAYDLPHIFVSARTDNYNRNVMVSRFPFADLNGDTLAQRSDCNVLADEYALGGALEQYRGFMFAEFDLPDGAYAGDLVVGNAHLKAGSQQSDKDWRERAARNTAYYIDYLFNGAGTELPDPHDKIQDDPPATAILAAGTPVVIGGDWNEDELSNGRKGPAEWLTMAATAGDTDGTDRDRSDMTYDDARNPYDDARMTCGSSKFDYVAWQDSIAAPTNAFIFYTTGLPSSWYPPEIVDFPSPAQISPVASDHRPVLVDFVLPAVPTWPLGDLNCDGSVDFADINPFVLALSNPALYGQSYPGCPIANGDINSDGTVDFSDVNPFVALLEHFAFRCGGSRRGEGSRHIPGE